MLTVALAAAIGLGTAILLAALGEVIAERAGVMNLGVEGMMLAGAFVGFVVTVWTGSLWWGTVAALGTGAATAALHALLTVTFGADQIVSGLALVLFATGLVSFLGKPFVGQPAPVSFHEVPLPLLSALPVVGPTLFRQSLLTYLSYGLVLLVWFLLFRSPYGLVLRAAGENPVAVDALGHSVTRVRYLAVVSGGALAGLGGAVISLGTNPAWTENITAGRGWIAIALVVFASWRPIRVAVGAYLFGGIESAQFLLQAAGVPLSPFFLNMLPYLATLLVLVVTTRGVLRRRGAAPAALGLPYVREERT